MSIFRLSVGSDAKSMAVPCVFAIGVVCWANLNLCILKYIYIHKLKYIYIYIPVVPHEAVAEVSRRGKL